MNPGQYCARCNHEMLKHRPYKNIFETIMRLPCYECAENGKSGFCQNFIEPLKNEDTQVGRHQKPMAKKEKRRSNGTNGTSSG